MRPAAGQVLHFSENPRITSFVPHVAVTAQQPEPYVWAVDAEQAPAYWFPRDCPRVLAWPGPRSTAADRRFLFDRRMHAIEYGWLPALQAVRLYAYRFDAAPFRPFGSPQPHAMVATAPVIPLGPAEPVGDLLALHEAAGIQFRLVANLWSVMDEIVASTLRFSGIRLRNAKPRK
ncbi:hypothetical protein DMB66_04520 [Actinoplanes sp. ATCC 53533]|uniref:DUF6886 family protein n=1 Tax=Actinoplanes sp. ATCC 53533 TaxID=1288362 RepID=UPI000F76A5DF|nr:DUF6886 family protein [Actinoplanes sp. ATCC 53533]RSM72771.1 hypothetical protein DMB66_04520 [Actinoplanes sp. ATCC 53533]